MSIVARLLVFLLVFIPVVALGFAFRHPITNWVSKLGSKGEQQVVLTQRSTPTPTASPLSTPTPVSTLTAPSTPKAGTSTSIAQISHSPTGVSGSLPKSGPEGLIGIALLAAVLAAFVGNYVHNRKTLRNSLRRPNIF
jgi:hypothetical protein